MRSWGFKSMGEKMVSNRGVKIIELREIADEQAKKELLEYINGKDSIYPSDIADALRLPMEQVFSIVNKLFVEGRVEEAS